MRVISKYTLLVALLLCAACDRSLDNAIQMSGDNRVELEKVLAHFKDDPAPLKYRAAKFIIENMPYNYSNAGDAAEYADSAFSISSRYPIEQRDSIFGSIAFADPSLASSVAVDLKNLKADYLIKVIDEACDIWRQVNWKEEYDESIFFDYVLPYRLINEPVSLWRSYVRENFPFLYTSMVSSNRGIHVECEDCGYDAANLKDNEAASGKKMVMLSHPHDSLTFTLRSYGSSSRRLFFKYSTQAMGARANIYVNGDLVKTLQLEPTVYGTIFRENRIGVDVELRNGENLLRIECVDEPFGLDHVRVASLEKVDMKSLGDYSRRYCSIKNKRSGKYVTFDWRGKAKERQLELKNTVGNDSAQLLRLDYLGFPIWKIYTAHHDTIDLCVEVKDAGLEAGCEVVQTYYITTYQKEKINHQKLVIIPLGYGYC